MGGFPDAFGTDLAQCAAHTGWRWRIFTGPGFSQSWRTPNGSPSLSALAPDQLRVEITF
jgi:hypothetical protein